MTIPPLPDSSPVSLPPRSKWQFSLRTLLTGVTALAFILGIISLLPAAFSQAIIGIFWIAATGCLVTGLFFAQGDQRAFCIGAAVVFSSTWTHIGGRFLQGIFDIFSLLSNGGPMPQSLKLWLYHLAITLVACANGWLCIQARRYFEPVQDRQDL